MDRVYDEAAVRIVVTSDLHFDSAGQLTPPGVVEALTHRISDAKPDAVVLAGDIGHPLAEFRACLDAFRAIAARGVPVGVLAGNHDVWHDPGGPGSEELWERALPEAVRAEGMVWLETDDIRLGSTAIAGSLAWYDYSAAAPHLNFDEDHYARIKSSLNNDGDYIDWPWSDADFAWKLRRGLVSRLRRLQADASVTEIVVVTHVPLFEEQMFRKPADLQWELSGAYFGNFTTGREVLAFPKVTRVVSGHTHCGRHATVKRPADLGGDIEVQVVPSEYGAPAFVVLEASEAPLRVAT